MRMRPPSSRQSTPRSPSRLTSSPRSQPSATKNTRLLCGGGVRAMPGIADSPCARTRAFSWSSARRSTMFSSAYTPPRLLAHPPPPPHQVAAAAEDGADGTGQPLAQAERYRVRILRQPRGGQAQGDRGVEDARSVQVDRQAVLVGQGAHGGEVVCVEDA